jgi:ABC-type antimicrobial peptide transport system permease subunit
VGFGLFSVADVLYLNVRERRAEHAALRAVGWSDAALMRLVIWEGLMLGLLGTLAGAGLGLLAVGYLVGALSSSLLAGVGVVVAVTVPLTGVVALVPALATRRNDTAAALAEA